MNTCLAVQWKSSTYLGLVFCVVFCVISDFYYYYLSDRLFVNCKLFHNVSLILLIVTETEKLVKSSKRKYAA